MVMGRDGGDLRSADEPHATVPLLKIATYNVNGVNGRLPVLLRWLSEAEPDVVCLQELKAPSERFLEAALARASYGRRGKARAAGTGLRSSRAMRSRS